MASSMNSSERIQAALAGAEVDRPPFSFWYNFGLQHMSGEAVADVHIAFARRFELDYLRVMNGYPYPLTNLRSFDKASDFLQIPSIVAEEGYWGQQLRALDKIVRSLKSDDIWVVDSVDSPWTVLCKLSSPDMVLTTARRRPEIVKAALDIISYSQVKYVQKAMELGIKGIFFTLTEAAYDVLDPLSQEELCQPYNNRVLEAAASAPFNILRIDSKRLYFDTLKAYQTQVVSWPHFAAKQSLRNGIAEWKRTVLGGVNHETVAYESPNKINAYFEKYAEEFFQPHLLVGPSGILPTDISTYVLDGIGDAIRRLPSLGRMLRKAAARERSAARSADMENYYAASAKEELRNYTRREKPVVPEFDSEAAANDIKLASEVASSEPQVAPSSAPATALSLEEQDFSAPQAPAPSKVESVRLVEHPTEEEAAPATEGAAETRRAPRWAARLVRRDYEREDRDQDRRVPRQFSKDDPRRFDMAYRKNDRGHDRPEDDEPRYNRYPRRSERKFERSGRGERRGERFPAREGRRDDRFAGRGDKRSERFPAREGRRDDRFAGRGDKRSERFSSTREGRRSERFGSRSRRPERPSADRSTGRYYDRKNEGGVKRIRVPRERRS